MDKNIEWELNELILMYETQIRNFKFFPQTKPKVKKYIQRGIDKAEKEIKNLQECLKNG